MDMMKNQPGSLPKRRPIRNRACHQNRPLRLFVVVAVALVLFLYSDLEGDENILKRSDDISAQEYKDKPMVLDFELVNTIDTKPFAKGSHGLKDSESLTYSPQDDTFWIGDDDGKAVHQFAHPDGHFIMKVTAADIVAAFPGAGQCRNETGTDCSYTKEFETLACDPATGDIYIVNTVNDSKLNPPVDRQAIFKIRKVGASVAYQSWHPLPPEIKNKLDAIIIIDGRIYGGGDKLLVEYDFEKKNYASLDSQNNPTAVYKSKQGRIVGLGYEAPYLWILTTSKTIVKVDWRTKLDVGISNLASVPGVKLGLAKGLEVVAGEIYVVDGDPPHKIFVLRTK